MSQTSWTNEDSQDLHDQFLDLMWELGDFVAGLELIFGSHTDQYPPAPQGLTLHAHGQNLTVANGVPSGGTVDSLEYRLDGETVLTIGGFGGIGAVELYEAINTSNRTAYDFLISLVADATLANGSEAANWFDTGAGNDTIFGGGGDDVAYRWKSGDLSYFGGAGQDTLIFEPAGPTANPPVAVQQLVVDLLAGTGQNPFGGALVLDGVENIIGTAGADILRGDNRANVFGDGIVESAGDIIKARGGNDTVKFFSLAAFIPQLEGARVDGGNGIDTLFFQYDRTGNVLDLTDQSQNAGMFRDSLFRNFERFVVGGDFGTSFGDLRFRGDGAANHLEVRAGGLDIDMGGGDDTLVLLSIATSDPVQAAGGRGTDRLIFAPRGGENVLDLADPSNNTGPFIGVALSGFEIFEIGPRQTSLQNFEVFFDFRGDGRGNTAIGGRDGDLLSGRGGNDSLTGLAGDDSLTGGAGNDSLAGGTGNDTLDGGAGRDRLAGGGGADAFHLGGGGADNLVDFTSGSDRIVLAPAAFAALGPTVTAGELRFGSAAQDGNDRLIYNQATGRLSYDADADGAGAAVLIATLGAGTALVFSDILIG